MYWSRWSPFGSALWSEVTQIQNEMNRFLQRWGASVRSFPACNLWEDGDDVHVDSSNRTVVTVTASDMYRLFSTATAGGHVLSVVATAPGLEAYAFTFG